MSGVVDPESLRFTIRCRNKGGVEIKDGKGKAGGNLRTAGGNVLAWTNKTDQDTCYLRFASVSRTDDNGKECWPFEGPSDGGYLAVRRNDTRTVTLKGVTQTACVEYEVLDAEKQSLLDPVIIIDPN
jgi:hypothetical protein